MDQSDPPTIFSIGHSTHTYERFLALLRNAGVTAVADVRTAPYSRRFPHFNRATLKQELKVDRIAYSFLGKELGGRPSGSEFYCEGVADYEKMVTSEDFQKGLDRLLEGAAKYKIAMMCSEHDPLDCHRCLLVGRALKARHVCVHHILSNGKLYTQTEIETRLVEMSGKEADDMFISQEEKLAAAYRQRARKVAFAIPGLSDSKGPLAAE
ncbi:MAG: DUF488 family protein [Methylocella sp.]